MLRLMARQDPSSPRPVPKNPATASRMSRQAREGTGPEVELRRQLHRRGLRYRLNAKAEPTLRTKPDIVFRKARVAVFVDGCFWHSCPEHSTAPQHNGAWWHDKLARNVERDRRQDKALKAAGWEVIRVWEHEDSALAAERVARVVESASSTRFAPPQPARATA